MRGHLLPMQSRHRKHMILASTFSAALGALPLVAHNRRDRLVCDTPFEWARLALATYAASRIVAREKVGSFIREPLVDAALPDQPRDRNGDTSAADTSQLLAQQDTWKAAFAELVTCTRCVGVWNAAFLTYLRALAPSHGRVAVDVLSVVGANNFLQAAFARVTAPSTPGQPSPQAADQSARNGSATPAPAPRTQDADLPPAAAHPSRN